MIWIMNLASVFLSVILKQIFQIMAWIMTSSSNDKSNKLGLIFNGVLNNRKNLVFGWLLHHDLNTRLFNDPKDPHELNIKLQWGLESWKCSVFRLVDCFLFSNSVWILNNHFKMAAILFGFWMIQTYKIQIFLYKMV